MNYYDEDFKPWEIVDGQCVVADEAEWSKLVRLNDESDRNSFVWEQDLRPIVKLTTDIFEDVKGPLVDGNGNNLFVDMSNGNIVPFKGVSQNPKARVSNILKRFFQTIDATLHVDYLIVTQRPELVREKWPMWHRETMAGRDEWEETLENVILATYVETQSDIERLVPELLKCHDLCKGLAVVCNPKEKLDFREVNLGASADNYFYVDSLAGDWVQEDVGDRENPPSTMCHDDGPSLNLIIAEGNEHPIHPQWVRCLRDQCLDAGVEFKEVSNE